MKTGSIPLKVVVSVAVGLWALRPAWGAPTELQRPRLEAERIVSQYQTVSSNFSVTGAPVAVEAKLWVAKGRGSRAELGRQEAILRATKAFAAGVKIPTAAACALTLLGAKEPTFKLRPGQTVTVAVVMQSSFDHPNPLQKKLRLLSTNP